jgi:hypothetical protein
VGRRNGAVEIGAVEIVAVEIGAVEIGAVELVALTLARSGSSCAGLRLNASWPSPPQ